MADIEEQMASEATKGIDAMTQCSMILLSKVTGEEVISALVAQRFEEHWQKALRRANMAAVEDFLDGSLS